MKANQVRELSQDELKLKEQELHQDMHKLRIQAAFGQVESPSRLRSIRRDLARVKTILHENEILSKAKGVGN